jgi:hypothetical protein
LTKIRLLGCLGVFSEGVTAFCASEELGCAFVAASGLHLPSVGEVVSAFWACHVGGGHGAYLVLFGDYGYAFLGWTLNGFGNLFCAFFGGFLVSTFGAYSLYCDFGSVLFATGNHACSALWTKLHNVHQVFCLNVSLQLLNIFFSETRYLNGTPIR